MPEDLASQTCVPCRGGAPPLKGAELQQILQQVPEWKAVNEHHLTRAYSFPDKILNTKGRIYYLCLFLCMHFCITTRGRCAGTPADNPVINILQIHLKE